jgi:CRISPR-associated protein Cas1
MMELLGEIGMVLKGPDNRKAREQLMGIEGRSAAVYWGLIKSLLGSEVYFEGRERKGAKDLVNSILNYGYGVLYGRVHEAVLLAGLNPSISFLHSEQPGKPTLIFDLIEEFRHAI